MKKIDISKSGWFYKMILPYNKRYAFDICELIRLFIFSLVVYAVGIAFISILWMGLFAATYSLLPGLYGIALGVLAFPTIAAVVIGVVLSIGYVAVLYTNWRNERAYEKEKEPREPSAFRLAYENWKNKTCVRVNLKD